tara:strand:- start:134 stop:583 length:450 start_codon:yes stop_codon:yes gene_type:complete
MRTKTNITNGVKYNKTQFYSEIKSLSEIINTQTKSKRVVDSFTADMLLAMRSGRHITDKMLFAIHNIIKRNNPEFLKTRDEWVMSVIPKINLIISQVEYTDWTKGYKFGVLSFLESVRNQAKSRMTLSKKQMLALNKMHKKIEKNIEKK